MKKSNRTFIILKIILAIYIFVNLIISNLILYASETCTLMFQINFFAFAGSALSENILIMLLAFCFFIYEVSLLRALFIKKSKYKLVSNIILAIFCIADTCICLSNITDGQQHNNVINLTEFIINSPEFITNISEIIIDSIFIFLIFFSYIKSNKATNINPTIENSYKIEQLSNTAQ